MSRRPTHPDAGMVYCCPECESSEFNCRTRRRPVYRCKACGHEFDERAERQFLLKRGPARRLQELDPEDLGLSPIGERA